MSDELNINPEQPEEIKGVEGETTADVTPGNLPDFDAAQEGEADSSIKEEAADSTPVDAQLSTDEMAQVAATEFQQPESDETSTPEASTDDMEESDAGDEPVTLAELVEKSETDPSTETATPVTPEPAKVEEVIIQIGGTRIKAESSLNNASAEQIKQAIADLYPEVKHATVSEATEDGKRKVQFASQPGRKG
jgi:hypothetical protein